MTREEIAEIRFQLLHHVPPSSMIVEELIADLETAWLERDDARREIAMGMFNHVNFEMGCPNCGAVITDWQTKDGSCDLSHVNPNLLTNFYGDCVCGMWVEFSRSIAIPQVDDFPSMGFVLEISQSKQMSWKQIETAPRDGKVVLAYAIKGDLGGHTCAYFGEGEFREPITGTPLLYLRYWRPLPEPPTHSKSSMQEFGS